MATLFARVLGDTIARLPMRVRTLHERSDTRTYRGFADIEQGHGWMARVFSRATGLPRSGNHVALDVTIDPQHGGEIWTRDFAGHRMRSILCESHGRLREKLGPATFEFTLSMERDCLVWRVHAVRVLGIALPSAWFANVLAFESENEGKYCFDVRAQLPRIGLLVRYRGQLDVD